MTSILPTKSEFEVLRMLNSTQGKYTLEIVKEAKGKLKRTSIYVLLNRLGVKGLIVCGRAIRSETQPGLPRPRYRLTGKGVQVLVIMEKLLRLM